MSVNKTRQLDSGILKLLTTKLLNEPFGDFVLLILSQCESIPVYDKQSLEMVSLKLESDCVVVEQENTMMKIERRNRSNNGSTSIALLAAQILLKAFEMNQSSMVKYTFFIHPQKQI